MTTQPTSGAADLPAIISGALFDFAGFLTTLDKSRAVTFSGAHEAGPAVDMLREWSAKRGLNLDEADVSGWRTALTAQAISAEPAGAGYAALPAGWGMEKCPDGSISLYSPAPKVGESRRTCANFKGQSGNDQDQIAFKLFSHMLSASHGQAPAQPADVFPMFGDEDDSDLGLWQSGKAKPTIEGTYLREFDEGQGISEFNEGKWLRDGFFPSDIQDARWRGRTSPKPIPTPQAADTGAAQGAAGLTDCDRCKGSGEDPEGFYDQSRGPDGDTHDGPCRSCGGSGAAPQPAPPACTRSHPHEAMTWQCQIRTVTAEMHNMEARGQEATEHTLGRFADALDAALLDATAPPADSVLEDAARWRHVGQSDDFAVCRLDDGRWREVFATDDTIDAARKQGGSHD